MPIWTDAVTNAIRRHVARTGSPLFTRQELMTAELGAMEAETQTRGLTPSQTMGRELQQLRTAGLLEFLERGTYRWIGPMPEPEPATASKGVFSLPANAQPGDEPERSYHLQSRWLRTATRMVGQWIIYHAPQPGHGGKYVAAARVEQIDAEPDSADWFVAQIARGSFLEFGRAVPFQHDGTPVERGLLKADGRLDGDRAARLVRALSDADFNRIVELGLVAEEETLPRTDADEEAASAHAFFEEQSVWEGPIDRTTMLGNRKVRDRQFRERVLAVYGSRCALTGMKLINGGGRAEAQAAHIMRVKAGGPDKVDNGIALSGTVHWMFDRGLISLSDRGDILLSRGINDRERVERLIYPDRKARFPAAAAHRPHPRYLNWHRKAFGYA
jgi:putative restriction endonuclease